MDSKNKKAFIFTLDVAIALVVVFAILFASSFFVVRKSQDPFSNLQLIKTGSDMITIMEYQGYFDEDINTQEISDYIDNNLHSQYKMNIKGTGDGKPCKFEVGGEPPDEGTVASAKAFFSTNEDYCSLRYEIWLI